MHFQNAYCLCKNGFSKNALITNVHKVCGQSHESNHRMQKTALRSVLLFQKSIVKPFSVLYFLDY